MRFLSEPTNSPNLSNRGRPKKFPDLPTSIDQTYYMQEEEILYHLQYHKGPIVYAHFSLSFKEITGIPITREVLKNLVRTSNAQYACFHSGENFIIGPCVDLFLLRDPKAKAAFITSYAPGAMMASSLHSQLNSNTTRVQGDASTSQLTDDASQVTYVGDGVEIITDGSDLDYDPRFDPQADDFQGVSGVFFDEDADHGPYPLWRDINTLKVARIPRGGGYEGMNAEDIDLYSKESIERIISKLPSTIAKQTIDEYHDSLGDDDS